MMNGERPRRGAACALIIACSVVVMVFSATGHARGRQAEARIIGQVTDIFNALNRGTVTGVTMRAGATFLRPTAIMPPRIVELAASYSF
jgi:hypothetical protein